LQSIPHLATDTPSQRGDTVHIGTFTSEVAAAVAWDEAAVSLRGQKTNKDFPGGSLFIIC